MRVALKVEVMVVVCGEGYQLGHLKGIRSTAPTIVGLAVTVEVSEVTRQEQALETRVAE